MGINFRTKTKKVSVDYDIGYFGFMVLRSKIATLLDNELGGIYSQIPELRITKGWDYINKHINEIIGRKLTSKTDKLILDFLFASDSEGRISYKNCQAIYDLIKDDNDEITVRYQKDGWQDFKKLLLDCANAKASLYWG